MFVFENVSRGAVAMVEVIEKTKIFYYTSLIFDVSIEQKIVIKLSLIFDID